MKENHTPLLPAALDPRLVGQRLAEARKARGVTQEQAAAQLGCSRPTLIAIEKGERSTKAAEIVKLAAFYGRSIHELVRPGEPAADLQPHLRGVAGGMKEAGALNEAISQFQGFAEDYRELERIMETPLRYNYPDPYDISSHGNVAEQAEDVANRERQRLSLGEQPILNLRNILEWEVGLRIFYGSLPSVIAGMYAYVAELGGCILVNGKHPATRRRASLAHEYGHLIADRFKPGIDYLTQEGRKPTNERFAEAFAMAFLMPATAVRQRFREIADATSDFQVADLIRLSHYYFVSAEAMTLRLEELGLIPRGSWQLLKENGLKVRTAEQVLKLRSHAETKDPYPERYMYLAVKAYLRAEISEGQLARFLHCDRVTAREIVERYLTSREVAADGQEETLQAEEQISLLHPAQ